MAGTMSIPNTFQNQAGNVPASELDDNWTAVRQYVNAREVTIDVLSNRPSAGTAGRWFCATDVAGGTLYVDNGSTWVQVAAGVSGGGGGGGVTLYLTPVSATFADKDFPTLTKNVGSQTWDYTLDYDSATIQSARWEVALPANFAVTSANITVLSRKVSSATGTIGWILTHRAASSGTPWDVAGSSATITAVAVGADTGTIISQGNSFSASGWLPQDLLQFEIHRDLDVDTLAASTKFMGAVIRLT